MPSPIHLCLTLLCLLAQLSSGQYLRGVNLAGAEFGDTRIPGKINTDYTYNSERSFQYFAAKNLTLIRIPIRWERIQPALSGPLDPTNLSAIKRNAAWAKTHGARVIIDIHNYGRYRINEDGALKEYLIDNRYDGAVKVSRNDFSDLWVRLSAEFKDETAVYAYGLMNEPHDMGTADWKAISQAALTAIRNNGDDKLVMVGGDGWSAAHRWPAFHGPTTWIRDPANRFVYEAHQYFDSDNSGTYKRTYDQELAGNADLANLGRTRVSAFIEWCNSNGVKGFLGEFGAPNADPRWLVVLDGFLAAVDAAGFDATYWAAGEWWGSYALSVQPQSSFTIDRPQLAILLRHLAPGCFTTVSAASQSGGAAAPDSLVSGFGAGLAPATRAAAALPLPTVLAETEVELTDSSGIKALAPLVFVSPSQINYLVPPEIALGRVNVSVKSRGNLTGTGVLYLEKVAPALFAAGGDGRGVAAAQIVRIKSDGTQRYEPVARFDQAQNKYVPAAIDFGDASERLFLVLYGTGFRGLPGPGGASLQIGAATVPLMYAGKQPEFPGLDQANAEVPRSLAGAGEVPLIFRADGKAANQLTLAFR
jgi:endoglucanase